MSTLTSVTLALIETTPRLVAWEMTARRPERADGATAFEP